MELKQNGSQPSAYGPEEYFTGRVPIDPLFEAPDPSRGPSNPVLAARGIFIPLARR